MRKAVFILFIVALLPASAIARKTTYIVTNHRLNYVKLVEVKPRVAEVRAMTHPKEIDEAQMRAMLKSIKLSRRHVLSKEVDTQDTFDETSINFLAPALVKAFRQASSSEEVVFSYLMKNPFFIIRNDRLNLGTAWIHESELHMQFQKIYAKVTGDIDKMGNFGEAVAKARGLRIDFDLQEGHQFGENSTDEIVIDLTHNFEPPAAVAVAAQAPQQTEQGADVKKRLERLEQLKKDKLITNQEYKEKKKEILKDL